MRSKEFLIEGLSRKSTYSILHKFIGFAAKHLELDSLPKFDFVFDANNAAERKSFGGYGGEHIQITVQHRHIMDVCRTLAHELVHYKQDLNGDLDGPDPGATGSPQENEANAEAAVIMRNWGKQNPELFTQVSIG